MKKQKTSDDAYKNERSFPNKFPDYDEKNDKGQLLTEDGKLNETLTAKINQTVESLLQNLEAGFLSSSGKDGSVYTGMSGIALMYLQLYDVYGKEEYLKKAKHYIREPSTNLKGRKSSFIAGDGGPLAIAAVIYDKLGKKQKSKEFIDRLVSLHPTIHDESMPNELMNGRAGYLYALMYIRRHLGQDQIPDEVPDKTAAMILELGQKLATETRTSSALMYEWHNKHYLGACHGISGILSLLLQCPLTPIKQHLKDLIQPSVDFIQNLQFPSGNFPSSLGNEVDRLVHWCHGAPGVIHMLLLAYKEFKDEKYLNSALKCGDVIWKFGLLRKGYGLCHGVAGNSYSMLALYNITKDERHLYRACKFAEWCLDYGKHDCSTPDRPYSLFEGSAGTIYFLTDLLIPTRARFPCMYV